MPTLGTQVQNAVNVEPLIKDALEKIRESIRNNMTINRRHASHRSEQSLTVKTDSVSGQLYGSKSFLAMERGRKGGRVPYGFYQIIAQWIMDKGISVTNRGGVTSAAYLIARNIKEKGTQLFQRGGQQDIFSNAIDREVDVLGDKIITVIDSNINYILQRFTNTSSK